MKELFHTSRAFYRDGLSINAISVLAYLGMQSQPVEMHTLAKVLECSAANTTGLVEGLVRSGLVIRQAHEDDRRRVLCALTTQGRELLTGLANRLQEVAG